MERLSDKYWDKFKDKDSKFFPLKYSGVEFENLIEELLKIIYGEKWVRTKKSHDNNRDFWLYADQEKLWAECKNYKDTIAMNTLAPTLVMAQIYDVNTILFFSRSKINSNAKDKILAYGEKTKKKIIFYDAEILENLIIRNTFFLPKKYQPKDIIIDENIENASMQMYFFQAAFTGAVSAYDEFFPYLQASRIHYNEPFSLLFIIKNPFESQKAHVTLEFTEDNTDRFFYEYMHKNICPEKLKWYEFDLEVGEGKAVVLNMRAVVFKPILYLPRFTITSYINGIEKNVWQTVPKELTCSWVGKCKLIGAQYETILKKTNDLLVDNSSFSCLFFIGSSGTGKTRMLKENINVYLRYGYKILEFTAMVDYSANYFIKEIIYFIYEIPKSLILATLEEKVINNNSKKYNDSNTATALEMIRLINETHTEAEMYSFVDKYSDIIFEKLSQEKYVLVIDNIQFLDNVAQYFIKLYAGYSSNQNRSNYSILIGVFNSDYMTSSTSELLYDIKHLEIRHFLIYKLSGFKDKSQGVLFLRELIYTQEEKFDSFFERLIDIVSLKPYNLYQSIKLLEEYEMVKVSPDEQGYLMTNDKAWDVLLEELGGFTDVLNRRWEFILNELNKDYVNTIFSALYLFDKLDNEIIDLFRFNYDDLNFLCEKCFLKKSSNNYYEYDHDIIRKYFEKEHSEFITCCLNKLSAKQTISILQEYDVPFYLFQCCVSQNRKLIYKICSDLNSNIIPQRLANVFYSEIFKSCLEIPEEYSSPIEWIDSLEKICVKIRKYSGSTDALRYYQKAYNKIKILHPTFITLYSKKFRQFVHSYCDILVELHDKDAAELLIKDIIQRTSYEEKLSGEARDEKFVLRAIMYNRWYVSYNHAEPSDEIKNKRIYYMKESRDNIQYIYDTHKRNLIKYLNDSDEGYNFYGYYKNKDLLFKYWNDCIIDIPNLAPEKTMNYYRKLIQYDLINANYDDTLCHIKLGKEYLEHGEYSHEPLIFNTFFLFAEIMANLQHYPREKHYYITKLIDDIIQIQRILNNGKMGDILLLKGVNAYYSKDAKDVYYSFRNAFEEYLQKKTSRHWIKKELILENIHIAFTELNIYADKYDVTFLPIKYRIPLTSAQLASFKVSGIQKTLDDKMNLALI